MTNESKRIIEFLGCRVENCEVFDSKTSSEEVSRRYFELKEEGEKSGFVPLAIYMDDIISEIDEGFCQSEEIENTPEAIEKKRRELIAQAENFNAKEYLDEIYEKIKEFDEEMPEDEFDFDLMFEEIIKNQNSRLARIIDPSMGEEVILAKIPTSNPWELAVYFPMGGWNECPEPVVQAAVFKYWYEKHKAIPAVVGKDTWDLFVENPIADKAESEEIAKEQYAFCSDIVDQGCGSTKSLAIYMINSKVWSFWWD